MKEMHWGVLGGPDRLQPGLMTAHSGMGVPWPGRSIVACLGARLMGEKLAREVEDYLRGWLPADPDH